MSYFANESKTESIDATCPKCNEQFVVNVDIDVEVESPDPYITIKAN